MRKEITKYTYECDICEEDIDEKLPYEISGKHICNNCVDEIIDDNKDEDNE